jgi:hypothetical protein
LWHSACDGALIELQALGANAATDYSPIGDTGVRQSRPRLALRSACLQGERNAGSLLDRALRVELQSKVGAANELCLDS